MKKSLLVLFVICLSTIAYAQNDVTITGYIFDKETNLPLLYVNIGFVEKAVGTVSDENGKFRLTFDTRKINFEAILQISSIGYETIKLKASKFYGAISKNNKIYLKPKPYVLDEVVISNTERKEKRVGSSKRKENSIGYWLNKEALGGEIATKINIKNKNSKLHNLKFYVVKNNSGSIKVRVNIYEYNNGMPGKNLLKDNIYHTISKLFGEEVINLEPYNIIVNDSIVVSIELVKVYGIYVDFEVAASRFNGISFTRHLSQDKWRRYNTLMAFTLNTSFPIKKNTKKDIARELPKKITLYWDTSLSMKKRVIDNELKLLSNYLKKIKTAEVEVIKFNMTVSASKQFQIKKGKGNILIDYLRNTNYEGASNFAQIVKRNNFNADAILLFTDGNTIFSELQSEINVPIFSINTLPKANHLRLQKASFYADGHYINLSETGTKLALELMLNEVNDKTVYTNETDTNITTKGTIYGTVISASEPIQGAILRVKNSFTEAITDVDGNYSINANENDILIVDYFGMLKKEVLISNLRNININLEPDGELLDEILLRGKAKKELIDTPYGKKSFDAVGYGFNELRKEDILPSYHTLDQIISKLPGVLILGFGRYKRYLFARNLASSMASQGAPIIVIDDVIYLQSEGLDYLPPIDVQTIESVKVIKSLIGTNRYGSAGAYGAIIIKTQATSFNWVKELENKIASSALITGNDYAETLPLIISNYKKPDYISQIENAVSYKNALGIYEAQRDKASQLSIPYLLDVSDYFMRWDREYAYAILSNIAIIAYNNSKALKTLAYKLEALGKLNEAKDIYQRIAILRPKDAQSYRDLALIYQETGYYTEALKLYGQMLNNQIEGVDFSGLENVVKSELQHLLKKHRSKVDFSNIHADYLRADFKYDMRIVFEWNDPNTEFELQFVNPKKKFFKWSHTRFENKERILDEIKNGYYTEEFIIDDAASGEWLFNIESFNEEKQLNPTYLKYTVYRNYGLANETKTVKIINLNTCKPKVTFDKLLNQ